MVRKSEIERMLTAQLRGAQGSACQKNITYSHMHALTPLNGWLKFNGWLKLKRKRCGCEVDVDDRRFGWIVTAHKPRTFALTFSDDTGPEIIGISKSLVSQ